MSTSSDWPVLPARVLEGELVEKAKQAQGTLGGVLAALRALPAAELDGVEPVMAQTWVAPPGPEVES